MTRRIETRIFLVRGDDRLLVKQLPGRKPFVGIWWHDDRHIVAFGEPIPKAEGSCRWVDSSLGHVHEWWRIATVFGLSPESDYFEVPRGRILWDSEQDRTVIYHGNATDAAMLKIIGRVFHLKGWQALLDEHYMLGEDALRVLFGDDHGE